MIEKIWNPQTTGEKLFSRLFIHPGMRDNASRRDRVQIIVGSIVIAGAVWVMKKRIEELEEEVAELEQNSIKLPRFEMPKFSFTN